MLTKQQAASSKQQAASSKQQAASSKQQALDSATVSGAKVSSVLLRARTLPTTADGTVHLGERTARSLIAAVRWGNHFDKAFADFRRLDLAAVATARYGRLRLNVAQMQRPLRLPVFKVTASWSTAFLG